MALTLRLATEADASALFALENACFPHDPWSEHSLCSHLSSACSFTLIAEEAGECVGYLAATCIPPEGEILRVGVLPQKRGGGIGKALVLRALSEEMQITVCFLEVRAHNAPAIALYERVGFLTVGARKNYYTSPVEDALVMKWERREPPCES